MVEETRVFVRTSTQPPRSAKYGEHFFSRVQKPTPVYESDVAPLAPEPKKVGRVSIGLADAEQVRIARGSTEVRRFAATERPVVRFRGKLTIGQVEDEVSETEVVTEASAESAEPVSFREKVLRVREEVLEAEPSSSNRQAHPTGPTELDVTHQKGRGPLHEYSEKERARLEPLSNPDGVIGMQRSRITDRNPRASTLKVQATIDERYTPVSPWIIAVSGVFGLAAALLVSGLYTSVEVSGGGVAEAYGVTFASLLQMVRDQFAALIVHSFGR